MPIAIKNSIIDISSEETTRELARELSNYLNKYAETGNQYVEVLQQIIKQNKLKDFDDAKLLPSSSDIESLI